MTADDEITSLTEVSSLATGPHGAIFSKTHWSVVLQSQGEPPAAQEALEKLCRTYWRPVYSFIRREGTRHEIAAKIANGVHYGDLRLNP